MLKPPFPVRSLHIKRFGSILITETILTSKCFKNRIQTEHFAQILENDQNAETNAKVHELIFGLLHSFPNSGRFSRKHLKTHTGGKTGVNVTWGVDTSGN